MSGHSKWSKIKRDKAATDAKRSKAWARIARDLMVAAREGGGDPGMNPRLALAVEKAKGENMPKDNVERAIKRGIGEIEGQDYVEISYEGYAPGGVALFVEVLTENTNRTVADIRNIFSKAGGTLGQPGSVAFMFERAGIIEVPSAGHDELTLFELVADAGADDLSLDEDTFVIRTSVESFGAVQEALREANVETGEAGLQRFPTTTVSVDADGARRVANLIEKLEDYQDVQAVYSTMELDESTLAAIT